MERQYTENKLGELGTVILILPLRKGQLRREK